MSDKEKKYKCIKCGEYKTPDKFNKDKTRSSGLQSQCKECKKIVFKELAKAKKLADIKFSVGKHPNSLRNLTGGFKKGASGNPSGRPKQDPFERIAKRIFGERIRTKLTKQQIADLTEEEISGDAFLLRLIAETIVDPATSKRDKKDLLMWWANKRFANPKEHIKVEANVVHKHELAEETQAMLDRLQVYNPPAKMLTDVTVTDVEDGGDGVGADTDTN
jgi:hypothetical protein